ncbi:hypothetical protein DYBT9275_03538 [Dyadobacter sp. CECT 9275]|uniref:Uncharacterized protein n=1 Tax=Dyadobacter helix TaxID=2822344 RepID=A0A916JF42_9BACT|nr:hypothetical protein DYBT9275_03538 [Dyadobacter sp. CECT 9275]
MIRELYISISQVEKNEVLTRLHHKSDLIKFRHAQWKISVIEILKPRNVNTHLRPASKQLNDIPVLIQKIVRFFERFNSTMGQTKQVLFGPSWVLCKEVHICFPSCCYSQPPPSDRYSSINAKYCCFCTFVRVSSASSTLF